MKKTRIIKKQFNPGCMTQLSLQIANGKVNPERCYDNNKPFRTKTHKVIAATNTKKNKNGFYSTTAFASHHGKYVEKSLN